MNAFRSLTILISRIPPALLVALIVGVAALTSMLVTGELDRSRKALDDKRAQIDAQSNALGTVVIASRDIPEGKTIGSEFLEEKRIPAKTIPADALTSASLAAGRLSKYGISQGNIVSQHDLAPLGVSLGFESRLKPGMRAVTFAVDSNSGVAGFVTPESRVDVMSMVGSGSETKVAPILSDVEVIAVGQMYHKEPGSTQAAVPASSVTVAISPEDAQKLVKGVAASKLYLALRCQGDRIPLTTVDVTSLYAKKPERDAEMQLAHVPPPPLQPVDLTSPSLALDPPVAGERGASAGAIARRNHEIEVWTASKKDLIEIQGN